MRNDESRTRELVGRTESRGSFRNPAEGASAGAADGWYMRGEERGCQEMVLTRMHLCSRGRKYSPAAWLLKPEIRNTVSEMMELR